jgi:hypothetical protein
MGDEALLPFRLFRNRVFALGSAQSAIIGVGMFGGITLLPLYLQLVKGNSPTRAGLLTLPTTLGLKMFSVIAGQITSRTGRYKIFPVVGSALLVTGLLMLWRLSADSSLVYADIAMFVVGAGLGFNMQTIVLAMQNSVSPRDIGVATSSTTFFRQLGGTLGVAVFLSIVYSTVGAKITGAYAKAASDPAFQAAAKADPDGVRKLQAAGSNGGSNVLNDTSFINGISKTLTHPFLSGFTSALTTSFLVGACVVAIAFVLALFMKEVPLRLTAAAFTDKDDKGPAAQGEPRASGTSVSVAESA